MDRNLFGSELYSLIDNVALLAEGVDRNNSLPESATGQYESPSSRRAWIEMSKQWSKTVKNDVALLAEGVDRN